MRAPRARPATPRREPGRRAAGAGAPGGRAPVQAGWRPRAGAQGSRPEPANPAPSSVPDGGVVFGDGGGRQRAVSER